MIRLVRKRPQCWWLIAGVAAGRAQAHGFDERYDLPVPLRDVIVGACAVVLLSFVVAALYSRAAPARSPLPRGRVLHLSRGPLRAVRGLSFGLFVLTIAAALWGTRDPLMNLAPTLVWIIWWVGLSFVSALLCNLWPALDPWRSGFEVLDGLTRRLIREKGLALGWRWPAAVGMWPAVALLLAWCWLEVVQPLASTPLQLGRAALLWTVVSWLGMAAYGRSAWQAHADPFAINFAMLGRMAPLRLAIQDEQPRPVLSPALSSTLPPLPADAPPLAPAGQVAFVIAMLASVVFDGLHGGAAWNAFEAGLRSVAPTSLDINGLFAGTVGLLSVWLALLLAYLATLRLSLAWMRRGDPVRAALALTLVPIAAAYNIAHNFSSLALQGQAALQLLSDPFGWQWNLFGTARWHPDIGLVDARLTWFVAVFAIVAGHVVAIAWSHRVVLAAGVSARRAAWSLLPLTVLMVAYTAISMMLIAEPMVIPTP